jgi:hypothetical protein
MHCNYTQINKITGVYNHWTLWNLNYLLLKPKGMIGVYNQKRVKEKKYYKWGFQAFNIAFVGKGSIC